MTPVRGEFLFAPLSRPPSEGCGGQPAPTFGNTGAQVSPCRSPPSPTPSCIEQARGGDEAAFTELYVRHQPAALRLARTYRRLGDPDELVNGAFERVLGAIKRGAGPTESFRAYLFVTLRRFAAEKAGKADEESLDDVPEPIVEAADSPALAQADRALISQAFESLPERWQAVLWHTAVEGQQPKELAGVLGVSANAAAAMAYRAREKLRQAYLQAHLMASPAPDHEPYRSQLGAYVRGGLSPRDAAAVEKHLDGCESCRALVAELEDVNRTLARAVLPLFLLVGGGQARRGARGRRRGGRRRSRQRQGDGPARQGPAAGPGGRRHGRHRRCGRGHGGDGLGRWPARTPDRSTRRPTRPISARRPTTARPREVDDATRCSATTTSPSARSTRSRATSSGTSATISGSATIRVRRRIRRLRRLRLR